ncbi:FkbM family methyltransferase [Arthrobacter sp. CAN_A6]
MQDQVNAAASTKPDRPQARINYDGQQVLLELPSESDHISAVILKTGTFYELDFLQFMRRLLEPNSLVVDVGANIGNHTLFFSRICSCRVVSYEPLESTALLLKRNVELNFTDGTVSVRVAALGEVNGKASVSSFTSANVGGARLCADPEGSMILSTLDAEWFESPVAYLKIDAEGMDLAVLRGAMNLVDKDRPLISCEASDDAAEVDLLRYMRSIDYAPLGEFNATPTFIFAPIRGTHEMRKFFQYQAQAALLMQSRLADLQMQLDRSVRYSQRLISEHIAESHQ